MPKKSRIKKNARTAKSDVKALATITFNRSELIILKYLVNDDIAESRVDDEARAYDGSSDDLLVALNRLRDSVAISEKIAAALSPSASS